MNPTPALRIHSLISRSRSLSNVIWALAVLSLTTLYIVQAWKCRIKWRRLDGAIFDAGIPNNLFSEAPLVTRMWKTRSFSDARVVL